ncbi:hypothetical protein HDU79_007326 [Rhizoclosmatium sp. JEL0117]|nr:hypothetical protein HDU79_007326 [Rhizoclosmatium sp. JEL0117]
MTHLRPLSPKEASYLSDATEFTNFGYSLTLSISANEAEKRLPIVLERVSNEHPNLGSRIAVSATNTNTKPELVFERRPCFRVPIRSCNGASIDGVVQTELATPFHVFRRGLARVVVVGNSDLDDRSRVGLVFVFSHAAFDGAVAAQIVFSCIKGLLNKDTTEEGGKEVVAVEDKLWFVDMIPKTERTWTKFIGFILNLLGLYYFIYKSKPVLLKQTPVPLQDDIQSLFENLRQSKGIEEHALHSQLTLCSTTSFNAQDTAHIIQRAKTLKVSVTSLLCGAMGAAFAHPSLLPTSTLPESKRHKPQISLLAGLAVNGRPARHIPSTTDGTFNYILLLPHVSISQTSDLTTETDIQSLMIFQDLRTRLARNEPFHLARFLPAPSTVAAKWKDEGAQSVGFTPKMYQLAPVKAKTDTPVAYTLSNVGNFNQDFGDAVQDFRMVSTMRTDINTRRVEVGVVTLDGRMTVTLSWLNGMVGDEQLSLLKERFLSGLMG